MGNINYNSLVIGLIKPLVTHPEDIKIETLSMDDKNISLKVLVHKDDIGRVIGKKGRVASSIRTLAYAAAMRNHESINLEFEAQE